MTDEQTAETAEAGLPQEEPRPVATPMHFPPAVAEHTYPMAIIDYGRGDWNGHESVIMTITAKDDDGAVRRRHFPMDNDYAERLEGRIREARGVPVVEIVSADQLPADARG